MIIGPGSRQLDAQFSRDIRLGRTRVLTCSSTPSNLLNMVNYAAIDTVVNSPTFGQVLSVRPMRSMQADLQVPVLEVHRAPHGGLHAALAVLTALAARRHPGAAPSNARPSAAARDLVSVDVVVRDRSGNIVKGLTAEDFEVREDGRPQEILGFSFQEISDAAAPPGDHGAARRGRGKAGRDDAGGRRQKPMTSQDVAGRRLMVLLFDTSSMQPEDVQRAVDSASKYVSPSK